MLDIQSVDLCLLINRKALSATQRVTDQTMETVLEFKAVQGIHYAFLNRENVFHFLNVLWNISNDWICWGQGREIT